MKLVELKQQLEQGTHVEFVSDITDWKVSPSEFSGIELVEIPYLTKYENGVLFPETTTVAVKNRGKENEEVSWWKGIPRPFIKLQQQFDRTQYLTNEEYKKAIQEKNEGLVILELFVRSNENHDVVHIKGIKDNNYVSKKYIVYEENQTLVYKEIEKDLTTGRTALM